jgi:hypothetical protein
MKRQGRLLGGAVVVLLFLVALGFTPGLSLAQTLINSGNVLNVPVSQTEVYVGGQAVLVNYSGNLSPLVLSGAPTAFELQGDFSSLISGSNGIIYDPSQMLPYPHNTLPGFEVGPGTFVPVGGNASIAGVTSTGNTDFPVSVTVDGSGSAFNVGNALTINAPGTLSLTNGGAVGVGVLGVGAETGAVLNSGTVLIDSTSSLTVCCSTYGGGTYTQTAGLTKVYGTLTADGGVYINGGTLGGGGTVIGNITNSGGTVDPGDPTTLTIKGNYTQNSTGVLVIDIASATDFTKLDVTGTGTLDGTLDINFDGYVPPANTDFAFLQAGGVAGDFTGLDVTGITCPTCGFDLSTLSFDTTLPPSATPEPASFVLLGTALLGVGPLLRKRVIAQKNRK